MASPAFVAGDFRIFDVKGFTPRMTELRARVRPKLGAFGESLASSVGRSVGGEVFAHVAQHVRRTVNPPDDTWVAFGPDARGYKKHSHFKVAVSSRSAPSMPTNGAGRARGRSTRPRSARCSGG